VSTSMPRDFSNSMIPIPPEISVRVAALSSIGTETWQGN
jgi:hypothetical protein